MTMHATDVIYVKRVYEDLSRVVPFISFARRSDVDKYLEKYKLDLEAREYKCIVCGARITRENIGMIISDGGRVKLVCNDPSCMNSVNILVPP